MFMAAGLKGRTRDLYCGISSGDFGFGEVGPKAVGGEEKEKQTLASLTARAPPLPRHDGVANVFDARPPALLVEGGGGHAGLERMAGLETGRKERILIAEILVLE